MVRGALTSAPSRVPGQLEPPPDTFDRGDFAGGHQLRQRPSAQANPQGLQIDLAVGGQEFTDRLLKLGTTGSGWQFGLAVQAPNTVSSRASSPSRQA